MGWVFISSSEWKEEIPTFSFTVLLKSWQTYDGFAFVFYYFSPHYFYHQKAAQRQHCDTAEWSLGTKAYTFPRYGRCVISLWWEHTLPKAPKRVFLTLYLVARRLSSVGLNQSGLKVLSGMRQEAWGWQIPKILGSMGGSQLQQGRKCQTRESWALRWCQQGLWPVQFGKDCWGDVLGERWTSTKTPAPFI